MKENPSAVLDIVFTPQNGDYGLYGRVLDGGVLISNSHGWEPTKFVPGEEFIVVVGSTAPLRAPIRVQLCRTRVAPRPELENKPAEFEKTG